MTRNILKVSEFLAAVKDNRYETLLLGDLSFTQFESLTLKPNYDLTIRSTTKGAVFATVIVSGTETITFEGILISRLIVEAGATANLIDCDVEVLEASGNVGIKGTTISNLDVRGVVHGVDVKIDGFTCIRDTGKATMIRCHMTAESIITVTGSSVQFTNCRINRATDTSSILGWFVSKLSKYFVPKVELPPAKYVGCRMNFRVK